MKKNKLFSLILMFIVLFSFSLAGAGSAFAYRETLKVNTIKDGQTALKFVTKNGLLMQITIKKNGMIDESYRQVVKQVNDGNGYYTSHWQAGLGLFSIIMIPSRNRIVLGIFKRFGNAGYGVIYIHYRHKKVRISIDKFFSNGHIESGNSFSSPAVQNLSFKFNYPQPKSGNFSSKLIKFEKTPNKKYFILFRAVDGLEYSVLTSANNKLSNLFVVNPKGSKNLETKLFSVALIDGNIDIELTRNIIFAYLHSKYSIHMAGRNNTNLYYNFKNFK